MFSFSTVEGLNCGKVNDCFKTVNVIEQSVPVK